MSSLKDSFSDVLALVAGTVLLFSSAGFSAEALEDVALGLLAVLAVALLAVRPARLSALRDSRLLSGRDARRRSHER